MRDAEPPAMRQAIRVDEWLDIVSLRLRTCALAIARRFVSPVAASSDRRPRVRSTTSPQSPGSTRVALNGSRQSKCEWGSLHENLSLPSFASCGRLLDRYARVRRNGHLLSRSTSVCTALDCVARGRLSSAGAGELGPEAVSRLKKSRRAPLVAVPCAVPENQCVVSCAAHARLDAPWCP